MNKTKFNFFEQIYYAITKPMKYYRLTKTSGGRLTGFVFLFVLITSQFFIVPLIYDVVGPNGLTDYIEHKMPAFELSDGSLHVSDRVEQKDNSTYLLIDTNVEEFNSDDIDSSCISAILVSKTNMITYQYGRTQIIDFAAFGNLHLDNRIIKLMMPIIYLAIAFTIIFVYLLMVGFYFLTALLYSLAGLIVSVVTHSDIKYAKIFKTSVYGKVTTSILSSILMILPLAIPGIIITGLSILVNCTYVVYGTLSHNSEEAKEEDRPITPQANY